MKVTEIKRLASGYWRVQFDSHYLWAQWPVGDVCSLGDVRVGQQAGLRVLQERLACLANQAVPRG